MQQPKNIAGSNSQNRAFGKRLLSCLLFFCVLISAGYSHPEDARKNRIARAGIFNFEGYHSKKENGELEGYGIDLLRLLSEYSNLNFNFVGYDQSWQKMQDMLLNGEIDLVSSARRYPEREAIFAFSLPVGRNHTVLSRQLHNTKIKAGEYSTYNNMKIGVIAGSYQNQHLATFAKEKGFNYTQKEYATASELDSALQRGEVDAILSSTLRKPKNETLLDIIQSDNFYVIARKEDQALIDEINYAIEQMNLNEGDWQNELYYQNYGPEKSLKPEFSERENAFASAVASGQKKIAVTANPNNPPYSYIKNDVLQGILPEYFQELMEFAKLPYSLSTKPATASDNEQSEESRINVVLDRLQPAEYMENVTPAGLASEPYLSTALAMVTRRGAAGPYARVALPSNFPITLDPEIIKNSQISYYPTAKAAMQAVEDDNADAAYVLPFSAQLHINRNPSSNLASSMISSGNANFHMYVPSNSDHELITIINKAIKGVPTGTLNDLGTKYVSFNADKVSLFHYLYAHPQIMLSSAIAIMLALSMIFVLWLRGKWNRRILAATESANHELEGQLAIVEALSRDYSNVLAINPEDSTASLVKITGFDPGASQEKQKKERKYKHVLDTYINQKAYPEDKEYLSEALALPTVLEKLEAQQEYSGTFRILQDGEIQNFQFTFVRPHGHGEENLILGGFRNIDEVIRKEQEQKEVLAEALAQSNYANIAKTTFLNNMSHDIRTPMNAILGFTTLAASNLENTSLVRRYLGKIQTSGNHLLNLINDVLDMSRIESGKIKLEDAKISLPELLRELHTIVQADIKNKQQDFKMEVENVKNETVFCDKLRLNQVLLNILSNAIKYTPAAGKILLLVRQTSSEKDGRAKYEFHIRDTGIGMSKEFLKHVFEPFEREQTATVSGIQGTGLGLAITKHIVDILGGSIEVKSESGKGSEFIVNFNLRVQNEAEQSPRIPELEGARALVIAKNAKQSSILVKFLTELGLKADFTASAKEGLEKARIAEALDEPYEACFLGPAEDDNGILQTVEELRKILADYVPLILLSEYDTVDFEEKAKEAGVADFLYLPIFRSQLVSILKKSEENTDHASSIASDPEEFAGRHILLAEDNEMNQEIAQMILESAGFSLEIVENGKLAVEKMQNQPTGTYDLILMDVQMPVMNGYDATRSIRKMEDREKASIPIIAMTANAFDEDREEAMSAGMTGYVSKPIDISQLMETLKNTLKNQTSDK